MQSSWVAGLGHLVRKAISSAACFAAAIVKAQWSSPAAAEIRVMAVAITDIAALAQIQ
jgi:hypothetical protein